MCEWMGVQAQQELMPHCAAPLREQGPERAKQTANVHRWANESGPWGDDSKNRVGGRGSGERRKSSSVVRESWLVYERKRELIVTDHSNEGRFHREEKASAAARC